VDLVPIAGGIGILSAVIIIVLGLKKFAKGHDHKLSLANVKLILWTGIILGGFFALAIANNFTPVTIGENDNSIILIAIATGTMPASSLIRSIQPKTTFTSDDQAKQHADSIPTSKQLYGGEGKEDNYSIAKMQMSAWNFVAMIIFIVQIYQHVINNPSQFPDLGNTLTSILGISNGIYLANKTGDKPTT